MVDFDLQGFRTRHQVRDVGILGSINRRHATWMCRSCGGISQVVGWRDGQIVAAECLACPQDSRQLSLLGDAIDG